MQSVIRIINMHKPGLAEEAGFTLAEDVKRNNETRFFSCLRVGCWFLFWTCHDINRSERHPPQTPPKVNPRQLSVPMCSGVHPEVDPPKDLEPGAFYFGPVTIPKDTKRTRPRLPQKRPISNQKSASAHQSFGMDSKKYGSTVMSLSKTRPSLSFLARCLPAPVGGTSWRLNCFGNGSLFDVCFNPIFVLSFFASPLLRGKSFVSLVCLNPIVPMPSLAPGPSCGRQPLTRCKRILAVNRDFEGSLFGVVICGYNRSKFERLR